MSATASDNVQQRSSRTKGDDGEVTPVERHSQQPSSTITLNDTQRSASDASHRPRIAIDTSNDNPLRSDASRDNVPSAPTPLYMEEPRTPLTLKRDVRPQNGRPDGTEKSSSPSDDSTGGIQTVQVVGQPTGWAAMAEDIRKYDEDKIKECRDDIDTLMTFAGLFSTAITAFLVESYQALLPSKPDETLQVLRIIAQQSVIANRQNSSLEYASLFASTPSNLDPSGALVTVNILWFASLISSLVAASFSMLVKHWLREYLAVNNPSAQARLRVRRYREPSLAVWKVFEIAAALPFLLQLALALFFAGLCIFTTSVHTAVGRTTTALVCAWAFCFLVATMLPAFFPRCPYKTPFLRQTLKWIHVRLPTCFKSGNYLNEKELIKDPSSDLDILADVDALQGDDEFLGTTILESIGQFHRPRLPQLIGFMRKILNHRCQLVRTSDAPWPINEDLKSLTDRGRKAICDIVTKYVHSVDNSATTEHNSEGDGSIDRLCAFLLSPNLRPLSDACVQLIRKRFNGHTPEVFRAFRQQLSGRSVVRTVWLQAILDTLRYAHKILDIRLDMAFPQFLIAMDTCFTYTQSSPLNGTVLYKWIEALSPDGVSATGGFLCDLITVELARAREDTRGARHTDDYLNSMTRAIQCALHLKQLHDARSLAPNTNNSMHSEISSLLFSTFITEDQVVIGTILTVFLQQKDTFYEGTLPRVLDETRNRLIEKGCLNKALSNYHNFIHSARKSDLPPGRRTLNRYLKLCFIAVLINPPSSSEGADEMYSDLLESFSIILSQCRSCEDIPSSQLSEGTLHRLCSVHIGLRAVIHKGLSKTLEDIGHVPSTSQNMILAPASGSPASSPWHFTETALVRSPVSNPIQHALQQVRHFVDAVPRRRTIDNAN